MSNRADDWLAQAEHDLGHARHAAEDGDCEAQQAINDAQDIYNFCQQSLH